MTRRATRASEAGGAPRAEPAAPGLARRRALAQGVSGAAWDRPADAVAALGAVQAQDYLGALWAVGLRTRGAAEADVEGAVAGREVVRTWAMRRTLHLVPAADVRWMLGLTGGRQIAASEGRLRRLGIDAAALRRARRVVERALAGGRRLTRPALYAALERAGVAAAGQRGIHVLCRLAQEGVLCLAARDGKQHTFALLEEWVPPAPARSREEALAEIAVRYFAGHGPATLRDFVWWTGLRVSEARQAMALAAPRLASERGAGGVLWRAAAGTSRAPGRAAPARLLPAFDELLVGYRDRSAALDPADAARVHHLLSPTILVGGRVVGTWTRSFAGESVVIRPSLFGRAGRDQVAAAAAEYGRFVGRRAVLG